MSFELKRDIIIGIVEKAYRDQIVTCDVGVSLHSKIHPLFMKYSNGTSTQCHAYRLFPLPPSLLTQWSYGVTCWEVFSLGRSPYPSIENREILEHISGGGRLTKPTLCPDKL